MKRRKFFIAILGMAVATIISVAIVSCKKEKQGQISSNSEQTVQDVGNMDEYLMAFKKRLLSAQKGEETISLEQAQRDLGNLLNFDFGDANYATDVFHYDTLYAKLVLTNGDVDLSQLAVTYSTLIGDILDIYHRNNLPEKSVYSISCNINKSESDGLKDVEIVVITRGYMGSRYGADTNDWRAGNRAGRCDGYLEGIWGGPEQVSEMLNLHVVDEIPGCLYGGRLYFTDETNSWKDPYYDADMVDPNSPCGYRLFFASNLSGNSANILPNTCILHDGILYYKNQCKYLFNSFKSTFHNPIPNNHVATQYHINYMHSDAHHYAWWRLIITHAKPNCTENSPII